MTLRSLPLAFLVWFMIDAAHGQTLLLNEPPPASSCISVTAGAAQSVGCMTSSINAAIRQQQQALDLRAQGPATRGVQLGLFNRAATQQQFGTAFGHSTIPQRPRPDRFSSPLVPPR